MFFNKKFLPLFEIEKYPDIRYVIIKGGRAGQKSTAVSHFLHDLMFHENQVILFSRYNLSAASTSIIPEFLSTLKERNSLHFFNYQKAGSIVTNKYTNSEIHFKGLRQSSAKESAKNKGIDELNVWILDEAEELWEETMFDDVDDSIRNKYKRNLVVLVLNTHKVDKQHFIYKRFFENKITDLEFNGIAGDTIYIHTTYLDNINNLSASFIAKADTCKKNNPQKYLTNYLGHFSESSDEALFNKFELNFYSGPAKSPIGKFAFVDTAGKGTDNYSMPVGYVYFENGKYYLYIDKVIYDKSDVLISQERAIALANSEHINLIVYETNQYGTLGYNDFKKKTQSIVKPHFASVNKHARIIAHSDFIKEYVFFRTDYKINSEYQLFMGDMFSYKKDGSQKTNDDAPDSMAGLIQLFRMKYKI